MGSAATLRFLRLLTYVPIFALLQNQSISSFSRSACQPMLLCLSHPHVPISVNVTSTRPGQFSLVTHLASHHNGVSGAVNHFAVMLDTRSRVFSGRKARIDLDIQTIRCKPISIIASVWESQSIAALVTSL